MNPNQINQLTVSDPRQLQQLLRELAVEATGLTPVGNVYMVMASSVAAYTQFAKDHDRLYDDATQLLHTTLASALSAASANDVILVAPGHSETITGAAGIALATAGVSVIGLGRGTQRPTFLMDGAATVDAAVTADDILVENIVFKAGHADVATLFEIGAAKNFTVRNCEAIDNTSGENFLIFARTNTTDNAADGLTIEGCRFITPDTASEYFLHLQGDIDGLKVKDNYVNMGVNLSDLAVITQATGKDMTNVEILRNNVNRLNDANDLFINNDTTANSGVCAYNNILHADTASEVLIDVDGVGLFENRGTAVVTASGYVLPAVDS